MSYNMLYAHHATRGRGGRLAIFRFALVGATLTKLAVFCYTE